MPQIEWVQDVKHNWRYAAKVGDKPIGFVVVITGGFMAHFPQDGRNKSRKFEGVGLPEIGRFLLQNWENENA